MINNNIISLYSNKCINFHPGILPEYAGMFVYQWAILNKEKYFGSSIHFINDKIDQGKIIKIKKFKILKNDTGLSMYLKCLKVGFSSFKLVLNNIIKNKKLSVKKQNLKNRNVFYIKDLPNSLIDLKKRGDYIIDFVRSGNFLPLKSPSFQPQIIKNIYIYKVKLLKKVNFRNSNLYFENFKPIVRTGDDYGIKIILAKYKSGKELEYNDWKKLSKKINNLYE